MERIYLIEDINGLKYVGRTKKKTLNRRLSGHKYNKKINGSCTSHKLDLDKCTITCLDIADSKEEARELEEFYINSIDCVNHLKLSFDLKEHQKEYYQNNKEKIKEYKKEYCKKNKDKRNRKQREYRAKIKKQALAQAEEQH